MGDGYIRGLHVAGCSGPENLYRGVVIFLPGQEDTSTVRNCALCQRSIQQKGVKITTVGVGESCLEGLPKYIYSELSSQ